MDLFTRKWIIENSQQIVKNYEPGILTLRGLHYQLVSKGMTNTTKHYKRVVNAMIEARWNNLISFDTFSDLDRSMEGETDYKSTDVNIEIENAKDAIHSWMNYYSKNRWENQEYYPEVFIEKKALQGVFKKVCKDWNVALGVCKGYPSLTFLYESAARFRHASMNKIPIIIYFGDYDPSGEDIPRSIKENMINFGVEVEVKRIALMEHQVIEMELPPAPIKPGDKRSASWDGLGQVELDAIKPEVLIDMCNNALLDIFDEDKYTELIVQQGEEIEIYRSQLRTFINNLKD